MSKPRPPLDSKEGGGRSSNETREILVPFESGLVPVSAVRNVLIQASLAELKAHGYFERYARLIAPSCLEELSAAALAPGWVPIDLALKHYEACERMQLGEEDFAKLGKRVGSRVQEVTLVSAAKKAEQRGADLWQSVGSLHRMWPRLYKGGGVQVVKVGPTSQLYEQRGFQLPRYQYYRQAHVAAVRATHEALGANITSVRVVRYDAARDDLTVRIDWVA